MASGDVGHNRAAAELLRSALPGEPAASVRSIETLLAIPPARLPELEHNQRRLVGAAMILAQARHGSANEAVGLATAELDRRLTQNDPDLSSATLGSFWAAASEAYLTAGLARHASQAARRAGEHALETTGEALRYRARSLLALARTLNGEYGLAARAIHDAAALEKRHAWHQTPGTCFLLAARLQLASARLDAASLTEIARRLSGSPESPIGRALQALAGATAALINGRPGDAIAMITAVANSTDQPAIPPLLRGFLISFHATALTARGEPQKALMLLETMQSAKEHIVCFDVPRASAQLQRGADREVLTTTDDCIKLGTQHCLRTLPSILLRRAIANERLGYRDAADTAFYDAFSVMHRSGAVDPLVTLPCAEVLGLLARMCDARPDLAPAAAELRRRAQTTPSAKPPPFVVPSLTERESLIASHLRGPKTLAEIAAALYVSRNTVKTQVSSLYRKLGTTDRRGTIVALERAGFFG
ncbi:MAG: helix-turn-helix transcriptional regulator [Propionibacteriaceae bacterium]|nr:helix-turn-helix transcriptional regulator [Propionibacteriaceae bacterium]